MISTPTAFRHVALSALLLTGTAAAYAQTAPAPSAAANPDDEVVELSVFTVSASEDKGYQAQNMLAGSRLKTELKDIANPVSAFTEQFFLDTGITDTNDLTNYLLSTESNFNESAGSDGSNQNLIITGNARPVRVRGLSGGSVTVNFFSNQTGAMADVYSTERIEQARGPNALLFGVGNPGGVLNSTTKRARLDRSSTMLMARIGSNNTRRYEFDRNQVLIRKKLAIRIAGMSQRVNQWRHWDFRNSDGLFGTVKIQLAKRTELVVEGERMRTERHNSRTFVAFDGYTRWRDAGSPIVPALGNAIAGTQTSNIPNNRYVFTTNSGTFAHWGGMKQTNDRQIVSSVSSTGNVTFVSNPVLSDFSIIPAEGTYSGPGFRQKLDHSRLMAFLTHSIGRNFNMELAAMRFSEHRDNLDASQNISYYLRADPNATDPTGAPNPNAGKPYMEGMPTWDFSDDITNAVRISANYRFDFGKFGKHLVAGVAEQNEYHSDRRSLRQYIISSNAPQFVAPTGNAAVDANRVFQRTYIDLNGPVENRSLGNPFNAPIDTTQVFDQRTGRTYTIAYIPFDANTRFLGYTQTTKIGMIQSNWFENRFSSIVGMARDSRTGYNSRTIITPNVGGNGGFNTAAPGGVGSEQNADNLSFSGVLRLNKWANLTFSRARNNGIPNQSSLLHSPTRRPPVSEGRSQDVGLKVSMLDNRLTFNAIYFQTSEDLANETGSLVAASRINNEVWATLNARGVIDPATGQVVGAQEEFTNASTFSSRTQGWEFEMIANPTPNWRIFANMSVGRTVRSNYGPEFASYLAEIEPFWRQYGHLTVVNPPAGAPEGYNINNSVDRIMEIARTTRNENEGRIFIGQRKIKGNIRMNYDFTRGFMKGVSVGGAARYQGRPVIGFDQETVLGVVNRKVYYGAETLLFDANIGYGRRTRVFGRTVNWNLQLNVENVFTNDPEYVVTRIQESGETSMYRFQDPRRWTLTYRVNF